MTGNRVSIATLVPLLSEVTGRTDINDKLDLIAEYALEAERKIGTRMWLNELRNVTLPVQNFRATLPKDYYSADRVDYCSLNQCNCGQDPCQCSCGCGTSCSNSWNINCGCGTWLYYYKQKFENMRVEGCHLLVPFRTGSVNIDYYALPLDEIGFPLIMASHRDAIQAYCLWQLKTSEYLLGKIPKYIYDDLKARWMDLCSQARGLDNAPTRLELARTAQYNNDPYKVNRGFGTGNGNGGWWGNY